MKLKLTEFFSVNLFLTEKNSVNLFLTEKNSVKKHDYFSKRI
jgi:hypothetical protein